jgi:formylmethanofuran dehydrogenase subunit B
VSADGFFRENGSGRRGKIEKGSRGDAVGGETMSEAEVDGKPASIEEATERAAAILSGARLPVVAGLGTDIAGIRGSIALAERLHGAYDHIYSDRIFADLDVMRQAGLMFTTPSEARFRADVLLLVGSEVTRVWPDLVARLAPWEIPVFDLVRERRKIVWIAPEPGVTELAGIPIETIEARDLLGVLAGLRARVAERPVTLSEEARQKLDRVAEILRRARFGVAVWGGAGLDALSVEMLQGLVLDLNKTTRFSGLTLGAEANAAGAVQASGWMTGFPMRTSFGRGFPEHDSWRFDATRLVESGEADAALWISAYGPSTPGWTKPIPLVALVPADASFAQPPAVRIDVGCPGLDHDCADFSREAAAIVARKATRPTNKATVAGVLERIAQQIGGAL